MFDLNVKISAPRFSLNELMVIWQHIFILSSSVGSWKLYCYSRFLQRAWLPVANDWFPLSWSGTLSSLLGNGLERVWELFKIWVLHPGESDNTQLCPKLPAYLWPATRLPASAVRSPLKFTGLCYNELNLQLPSAGAQKRACGQERSLSHVVPKPFLVLRQAQRGSHCAAYGRGSHESW